MATDNSPVVTEEKLLYFYNTYLKPYINAESGGHAIKNENDLLPLEQRETMVLNTPLMGSDDSTNEATVLDVDTNVDLSVIHAPGTRTPDEFEVSITNPQEGQVMRYNATSEQWENGDNFHVYSSEEHIVGKWIDSRPVYEKTISETFSTSGNKTMNHGISNLDEVVKLDMMLGGRKLINTTAVQAPSLSGQNDYSCVCDNISNTALEVYLGQYRTGKVTAIIQYTKTTDTV